MEKFSAFQPFVDGMHQSAVVSTRKGLVMQIFDISFVWTSCYTSRGTTSCIICKQARDKLSQRQQSQAYSLTVWSI